MDKGGEKFPQTPQEKWPIQVDYDTAVVTIPTLDGNKAHVTYICQPNHNYTEEQETFSCYEDFADATIPACIVPHDFPGSQRVVRIDDIDIYPLAEFFKVDTATLERAGKEASKALWDEKERRKKALK